jgi:hypothetical protein
MAWDSDADATRNASLRLEQFTMQNREDAKHTICMYMQADVLMLPCYCSGGVVVVVRTSRILKHEIMSSFRD